MGKTSKTWHTQKSNRKQVTLVTNQPKKTNEKRKKKAPYYDKNLTIQFVIFFGTGYALC